MKQNRIHLDKGKGMTECGKQHGNGLTKSIGIREGNQFFALPLVNPVKAIDICGTCLKRNAPGIFNRLNAKPIVIVPIAKPIKKELPVKAKPKAKPIAKSIPIPFPIYKCKINSRNRCNSEIPFDCQLCPHSFSTVKRIPVIQYKSKKNPIAPAATLAPIPIPAVKSNPIPKPKSKKELESTAKQLLNALFDKSGKGKVRELRQKGQLKVTAEPLAKAQFNKDNEPIELKASQLVDPELMKQARLNYSLRGIGMHPISDRWIITQLIGNDVKIISKIMPYKTAFAEFNRLIAIAAEKLLKARSKVKK
jgi:hypothetical protein